MIDQPLTILQLLPRLDTGGAERVAIEIADAIHQSGHIALIACEPGGALTSAALRSGAEIIPLPLAAKSPIALRRNARKLEKLIQARGVALVHAHSRAPAWSAFWATRRCKIPFVTTYHVAYNETSALKRRYNAVMTQGERVIAVSDFIADLVRRRYGTPQQKLRIIPGGVDCQKFDPAVVVGDRISRLSREWRVSLAEPIIMLPGRLTGWKGHRLLITALAQLRHRDAIAVFVGSDQGRKHYTQNLIALGQSLGVAARIRIVDHDEDMPAAMMLADVVVNASTDPEAFGRTIIEAQAMGRIVIAANHGGARETITDATGFLFPPGDAGALAAAIDRALDMPTQTRIEWGQQARAHVASNYSIGGMQDAVLAVYAELLA